MPMISHRIPVGFHYLMESLDITHHCCLLNHHEIMVQFITIQHTEVVIPSTFQGLPAVHSAHSDRHHGSLGPSAGLCGDWRCFLLLVLWGYG